MRGQIQTIVFDFDYTLADSSPAVIDCVNYALDKLGLPGASVEQVCATIGLSLENTFHALTEAGSEEQCREFIRLFVQRADEIMVERTTMLPDTQQAVQLLRQSGRTLGIVSTKFRRRIEAVLRREGLLDLFAVIIGGEDVPEHKPNPRGLRMAVEALGADDASTLYVGDSLTDAETARRADLPFVAVLSGVTPARDFERYGPVAVLNN
ncbi:MAG TPA: HAD-IA family hydrolase, partial [Chloroflexi bacterium]|nr:HAD-IA family hydrolase [Chloroflexota bacterium]